MLFKSREDQVFERIRAEIQSRLNQTGAPEEISSFLQDRWSRLMVDIYLDRGDMHPDWQAGWDTVNALLWSLLPKSGREETERLLRLLPTLLGRLQEGCIALDVPDEEKDALFSQLAMIHAAIARAGLQATPYDDGPITHFGEDADFTMPDSELAELKPEVSEPVAPPPVVTPPVAATPAPPPSPTHAVEAPTPSPVATASPTPPQQDATPEPIDTLAAGDVAIFQHPQGEKRLKLQWVSPMRGMFLFADDQGYDSVSLTRARLLDKLRAGEVLLPA